jgi:hypothetical protein
MRDHHAEVAIHNALTFDEDDENVDRKDQLRLKLDKGKFALDLKKAVDKDYNPKTSLDIEIKGGLSFNVPLEALISEVKDIT